MFHSSIYRKFFLQIPDFLAVINRDLRIEMCNWRGGYDYVPKELRRKGALCYELFCPGQGRPCVNCHVQEVFRTGQPLVREKHHPRIGYVEVRCFPLFDRRGKVHLVGEQIGDIARRKEIEAALRHQHGFVQELSDAIPVPIFYKNEHGYYGGCNKAFENYFGFTRNEIVGRSVHDLAPRDLAEVYHAKDLELLRRGSPQSYESLVRRADGSVRRVVFNKATFNKTDGSLGGVVGAILDVTEHEQAMARLQESEERYRQFFDDHLAGNYIASVDGRLLACNAAFARIFDLSSVAEALQLDLASIHPDPVVREAVLERLRQEKKVDRIALEARSPSGRALHLILSAVGIFNDKGELTEVRGYLLDDTDRQNLEEQLHHSQKMEAVGRLAAGLAHDFNNLLTVIMGYSEALHRELADPRLKHCAEQVHQAGQRAAALTDQLMALSRHQRLRPEEIDLNAVVAHIQDMVLKLIGADIELVSSPDPAIGRVMADAAKLEQVILNLAANARDAMPAGGRLTISTFGMRLDDEQARSRLDAQPGEYVVLTVADDGQGISEEVLPHIFEPFFTTKAKGKGTGLGLATAYAIVAQSGGFMTVDSRPGQGATFRICLPRIAADRS